LGVSLGGRVLLNLRSRSGVGGVHHRKRVRGHGMRGDCLHLSAIPAKLACDGEQSGTEQEQARGFRYVRW